MNLFRPGNVSRTVQFMLAASWAAGLTALWYRSTGSGHVLPGPVEVLRALPELWFNQDLAGAIQSSVITNLQAILLTGILGLAVSYSSVVPVLRPIAVAVSSLSFLGLVGFSFVFTVVLGGGHRLKVALLVFGMVSFFVRAMLESIDSIPREALDFARVLRMGRWRARWEVMVLGQAHLALDTLRQNAAMSWMMIASVEGLARSEGGVGVMLLNKDRMLRLDFIFAILLVVLIVGLVQDWMIGALRTIMCPYADLRKERT